MRLADPDDKQGWHIAGDSCEILQLNSATLRTEARPREQEAKAFTEEAVACEDKCRRHRVHLIGSLPNYCYMCPQKAI